MMKQYQINVLNRLICKMLRLRHTRQLMDIIWEAARDEFHEDNLHTRYHFLHEQLKESRDKEYFALKY